MPTSQASTFAHGEVFADTDSLLLNTGAKVISLDVPFDLDPALIGHKVSVMGHMGLPASSPHEKLIVEWLASHDIIAQRAFEIHRSRPEKSAMDNWLSAERELLSPAEKP